MAALRGLAAAHRARGQHERAGRFLARCLAVVDQATTPTLARVALAAAGDALISEAPNLDRESLKAAWLRAFPECEDPDRIRERIRTLIY